MKNKSLMVLMSFVTLLLTACSTSSDPAPGVYQNVDDALSRMGGNAVQTEDGDWIPKSYNTKIKPIIGSRQNDARVVMNTGKVLKIWVSPYKQSSTLIASHDVYAIVEKPNFITGEMVPTGKKVSSVVSCQGDYPFVFKDRHLETVSAQSRFKNSNIKHYVDNTYKAENNSKYYDKKRHENDSRYNDTIKNYIK